MHDLTGAVWRKASRSNEQGACVELALNLPGVTAVRDSKNPAAEPLTFEPAAVSGFLDAVKAGRFD